LSLMSIPGAWIDAAGTVNARMHIVGVLQVGYCTLTTTEDDSFSGSVDWMAGFVVAQGSPLELDLPVRGSALTGTMTTRWSDPLCGSDGVGPSETDLGAFHGTGTAAGATFHGTRVDPSGPLLPDGTTVNVEISLDLRVVPISPNP